MIYNSYNFFAPYYAFNYDTNFDKFNSIFSHNKLLEVLDIHSPYCYNICDIDISRKCKNNYFPYIARKETIISIFNWLKLRNRSSKIKMVKYSISFYIYYSTNNDFKIYCDGKLNATAFSIIFKK